METYNGLVRTPTDAIILFEACRLGILPRVQRRLSEKERQSIRSGSVFVWDEREAGMRRWTDGKSWSASRVSGSFLTYREMEGKRGSSSFSSSGNRAPKTPESGAAEEAEEGNEEPDGYRYKPDGLMKQSFSITTSQGQHLHLISYYSRSSPTAQVLRQPCQDPSLASIQPAKGMYPESTVNDHASVPAVTRSPMPDAASYVVPPQAYARSPHHPHPAYLPHGYIPHPAYLAYPLGPMGAPPPYIPYPQPGLPPLGYPHPAFPSQPPLPINQAPPSTFDQRPLRTGELRQSTAKPGAIPPAPYTQSAPPPPVTQPYPQPAYASAPPTQSDAKNDSSTSSIDPRLDPRLTGPPADTQTQQSGLQSTDESQNKSSDQTKATEISAPTTAVSQAPSLGAIVTGLQDAAKAASATTNVDPQPHSPNRSGSASPGGTKPGAPPQDIPSEKLGFREDKRALSMLDRAFARV
ncbi:hypothetical protein DV738_g3603, partial [Chaetothyriales sp. CBS 135597]